MGNKMLKDIKGVKPEIIVYPEETISKKSKYTMIARLRGDNQLLNEEIGLNRFACTSYLNGEVITPPENKEDRIKLAEEIVSTLDKKPKKIVSLFFNYNMEEAGECDWRYVDPDEEFNYMLSLIHRSLRGTRMQIYLITSHMKQTEINWEYESEMFWDGPPAGTSTITHDPHFHVMLEFKEEPKDKETFNVKVVDFLVNMYRNYDGDREIEAHVGGKG